MSRTGRGSDDVAPADSGAETVTDMRQRIAQFEASKRKPSPMTSPATSPVTSAVPGSNLPLPTQPKHSWSANKSSSASSTSTSSGHTQLPVQHQTDESEVYSNGNEMPSKWNGCARNIGSSSSSKVAINTKVLPVQPLSKRSSTIINQTTESKDVVVGTKPVAFKTSLSSESPSKVTPQVQDKRNRSDSDVNSVDVVAKQTQVQQSLTPVVASRTTTNSSASITRSSNLPPAPAAILNKSATMRVSPQSSINPPRSASHEEEHSTNALQSESGSGHETTDSVKDIAKRLSRNSCVVSPGSSNTTPGISNRASTITPDTSSRLLNTTPVTSNRASTITTDISSRSLNTTAVTSIRSSTIITDTSSRSSLQVTTGVTNVVARSTLSPRERSSTLVNGSSDKTLEMATTNRGPNNQASSSKQPLKPPVSRREQIPNATPLVKSPASHSMTSVTSTSMTSKITFTTASNTQLTNKSSCSTQPEVTSSVSLANLKTPTSAANQTSPKSSTKTSVQLYYYNNRTYRQVSLPVLRPWQKCPVKPARPTSVNLDAYQQHVVKHITSTPDTAQQRKSEGGRQVSIIEEWTEEEEIGKTETDMNGNDVMMVIYNNVDVTMPNGDDDDASCYYNVGVNDDVIYEEL